MTGIYSTLSRRYLLGKRGRSFMTFLGIALGVTMVVAVMLTNTAILASYESMLEAAAGRADLQISPTSGAGFPATVLDRAAGSPGVDTAAPVVTALAPVIAGDRKGNATFYGIDPERDRAVRNYKLVKGRLPDAAGRAEVAISTDLAEGLSTGPGQSLKLLTTRGLQEYAIVGVLDTGGTVRGALGPLGVMSLEAAQAAFGKEGKLDRVDLLLAAGAEPGQVRERLEESLGSPVRVGTPAERTRDMAALLDSIKFVLTMAGSISLFAGAFIIYTNVSMGVAERRRDLSALRALGMKRREVMRLVLSEAGFLGLLGSGLGLLWGFGLASAMAEQMTAQFLRGYGLHLAQVTLTAEAVVAATVVGVGTALCAAFGPASDTARVSPVEAMRPDTWEGEARRRPGWVRATAGTAMMLTAATVIWLTWPERGMLSSGMLRLWGLMMALVPLGLVVLLPVLLRAVDRWMLRPLLTGLFGITGRLAADNLVRQPKRTVATIASLMVSLGFMVGIGGVEASQSSVFNRWFDKTVGWDLNVSSSFVGLSAQVEMDPSFERELAAVEGVRMVSPQKMMMVHLSDGQPAFLQVFDHKLLRQYSRMEMAEGDWDRAVAAMESGGSALISSGLAQRLGAGVGDTITLRTPSGDLTVTVQGITIDPTLNGGMLQIDRRDYVNHWQDETSTNLAVLVQEGQDPAAVRERIMARFGERMHLTVRLNREFWAELKVYYDSFYGMLDGLIWIAVMVSGLAIANTIFASLLERKREVGILRAVGTRRGEVMLTVVGEALGTGIVGGVLGIPLGLLLQTCMTSATEFINGASADNVIGWGALGAAVAVALVLAPLIGLIPARWASRLDVVDALRYE